ncbi:hypothetical protein BHM03_00046013 [Ensete ventricosum]|nr:hypothetical protein BHM03_00046013 [Ensete ventricosum]
MSLTGCLHLGSLSPTSTISATHHFLHDNSNNSTVAYFSRVPASASSCPVLRFSDSQGFLIPTSPLQVEAPFVFGTMQDESAHQNEELMNDMIPLLPLQEFMSLTSIQGMLCASVPCSFFYVDSLHATWILQQVPPKLLRLSICIELMVALVPIIP